MTKITNKWSVDFFRSDEKQITSGNLARAKYFTIFRSNKVEGDVYYSTYEFDKGLSKTEKAQQVKDTLLFAKSEYQKKKLRKQKELSKKILEQLEDLFVQRDLEVSESFNPMVSFYSKGRGKTFNELTINTVFTPELITPDYLKLALEKLKKSITKLKAKVKKTGVDKLKTFMRIRALMVNPDESEKMRVVSIPMSTYKTDNAAILKIKETIEIVSDERVSRQNYAQIFNDSLQTSIMGFETTISWEIGNGNLLTT